MEFVLTLRPTCSNVNVLQASLGPPVEVSIATDGKANGYLFGRSRITPHLQSQFFFRSPDSSNYIYQQFSLDQCQLLNCKSFLQISLRGVRKKDCGYIIITMPCDPNTALGTKKAFFAKFVPVLTLLVLNLEFTEHLCAFSLICVFRVFVC